MLARAGQRGVDRIGRLGRGLAEEIFDATPEVEEGTRDEGTQALKEQEAGAGINVCMGLALEGKAKRDEKHCGEES
jgi:hypothetical protein